LNYRKNKNKILLIMIVATRGEDGLGKATQKSNLASGIRSKGRCLSCCTELHCIAQDALGKCAVIFGAESSSTIIHRKMNRTLTPAHRS
jgi:hypothetical protein